MVWVLILHFYYGEFGRSQPAASESTVVVDNLARESDCQRIAATAKRRWGDYAAAVCVQVLKAH